MVAKRAFAQQVRCGVAGMHRLQTDRLHIRLLPVPIPTVVKFVIVSAIAVPVCFTLSTLIRKMPYAKRVLG